MIASPTSCILMGDVQERFDDAVKVTKETKRRLKNLALDEIGYGSVMNPKQWAFAMCSKSPDGPWQDLTGEDPNCSRALEMPEAYAWSGGFDGLSMYLKETLGASHSLEIVWRLAMLCPFDRQRTAEMLGTRKLDRATVQGVFKAAQRSGYPMALKAIR